MHIETGCGAEARALAFLRRQGLVLVGRNLRCRFGEIDLVMVDGDTVVFVEVRYRRSGGLLGAAESIGPAKRRRLAAAAAWYLSRQPRLAARPARFDVVAIDGRSQADSALQWIEDAFRPGD